MIHISPSMSQLYFRWLLIAAFLSAFTAFDVQADSPNLELASPKNDDHFEVTEPLFFWKSSPGAQSYEIYVDDAKAGAVPSASIPMMSYGLTTPLTLKLCFPRRT
jgi:hypothetical protein